MCLLAFKRQIRGRLTHHESTQMQNNNFAPEAIISGLIGTGHPEITRLHGDVPPLSPCAAGMFCAPPLGAFGLRVTELIRTFSLFSAVRTNGFLKSLAPRRELRACLTLGGASQKRALDNFSGISKQNPNPSSRRGKMKKKLNYEFICTC